ncbi:hypothetical protein F3Y22_tig00111027pilonHSYRG00229 [Hibiscus syriacus]|uniref:Uncharacterized protein n=1 Tax=Hibiscus syriacus TaxID=106335 RepID=A0A6A2Z544_HIBSY|nr:hypothetical protein F3Y22_tig00111027pilonHSYRG00229 [Hibiscus syriacus]
MDWAWGKMNWVEVDSLGKVGLCRFEGIVGITIGFGIARLGMAMVLDLRELKVKRGTVEEDGGKKKSPLVHQDVQALMTTTSSSPSGHNGFRRPSSDHGASTVAWKEYVYRAASPGFSSRWSKSSSCSGSYAGEPPRRSRHDRSCLTQDEAPHLHLPCFPGRR